MSIKTEIKTIVTTANELGDAAEIALTQIQVAEKLDIDGKGKKAYVISQVLQQTSEGISETSADLSAFIDAVVALLNEFSWAGDIVAVIVKVLGYVSAIPSFLSGAIEAIASGFDKIYEFITGNTLNVETGEVTDADGNVIKAASFDDSADGLTSTADDAAESDADDSADTDDSADSEKTE